MCVLCKLDVGCYFRIVDTQLVSLKLRIVSHDMPSSVNYRPLPTSCIAFVAHDVLSL